MRTLTKQDGVQLLDHSLQLLEDGQREFALDLLFGGLLDLRESSEAEEWQSFSREVAVEHPIRAWIHDDPMTRRSFEKPRGYAGDAVLLDYIYGLEGVEEAKYPKGGCVYRFAVGRPAASAVRRRRSWVARWIDHVATQRKEPLSICSIASGHLREVENLRALERGQIETFTALDADPESCAFVRKRHPEFEVRNESFAGLFRDRDVRGRYDLVYSAGLFDYLEERIGAKLVRTMFGMLRPGGQLMLTNFLPTVVDAGYMESFMGWDLIYRDEAELAALTAALPREEAFEVRVERDSHRAVGTLVVTRTR